MWAIISALVIILVVLLYYNYNTHADGFASGNEEVYLVYAADGKPIEVDMYYTEPRLIADAFGSSVATLAQVRAECAAGINDNSIFPLWDISGIVLEREQQVALPVYAASASGSMAAPMGSSSSSGSRVATQKPPTVQTTPIPTLPGLVRGVLLYGPKPPYENREINIAQRIYRVEFYNTVRNVWSKYEIAHYKCKPLDSLASPLNTTYGEYARTIVSALEVPNSSNQVSVQITNGDDRNRAYPGCDPGCNVCEKTTAPFYPARQKIEKNKHERWKHQPVDVPSNFDPRILNEATPTRGGPDSSKVSAAIRLVNACRVAGGLPSLTATDKQEFTGCPATSWCCAPDTDISILLPLAQDDPAVEIVGKTCEPVEEAVCDVAPRPALPDANAYRLSKEGRRTRISDVAKRQFCKSKSASIRTLAQRHKSEKLLGRLGK
jgi:hypothetical protein